MSDTTPASTIDNAPSSEPNRPQRMMHIVLAAAVALAIIGAAWFVGERQGWSNIGTGGSNAQLLPKVGEEAPELIMLREDGTPVLLSHLRGQPVWINFWGSWCAPCRAEMPELQQAYETLAPQGLNVLSISMREDPRVAIDYRNTVGATFPVYTMDPGWVAAIIGTSDPDDISRLQRLMTEEWQVNNFPTHVFIDADGIVQSVILSQMTYDEAVSYGEAVMNRSATVREENEN